MGKMPVSRLSLLGFDLLELRAIQRVARFFCDVGEGVDLRLREQQPAVLFGQCRRLRFGLAGKHAVLIPVAEDIFDDSLHVFALRAFLREVLAADRVGADALEVECACALLAGVLFHLVPAVAQRRGRAADKGGVQLVDE